MELEEVLREARWLILEDGHTAELRDNVRRTREKLRKLTAKKPEELTAEARDYWDWLALTSVGFLRLPFRSEDPHDATQFRELLQFMSAEPGVKGYERYRRAAFVLLDWFVQGGHPVTATKYGAGSGDIGPRANVFTPSPAVDFLAAQLVVLDAELDTENPHRPGSNRATDVAYRLVQSYRADSTRRH